MEKKINVTCPVCGSDLTIQECTHKTAQQRIEALRAAGVDVSNLFAMTGANGGECIASNANGVLTVLDDNDPIFEAILSGGAIPNRKLFRRWVMSQMFHMLNFKGYGRYCPGGFTEALKHKGYEYQWTMVVNELNAQKHMLVNKDLDNFRDRNRWFHQSTVIALAEHYMDRLEEFIKGKPRRKCKGIPYIRINGGNVFVSDIYRKIQQPLYFALQAIRNAKTATELLEATMKFNRLRVKMPWKTQQCPAWVDAFKGSGAFFTLQNMIRFHGCALFGDYGKRLSKDASLEVLDQKAKAYIGEGWRMLGVLKKCLQDNNVDIDAKIASWRKRK